MGGAFGGIFGQSHRGCGNGALSPGASLLVLTKKIKKIEKSACILKRDAI